MSLDLSFWKSEEGMYEFDLNIQENYDKMFLYTDKRRMGKI